MLIDRFTKFSLSILVFSLCLNALNPWISPTLANAEIEDTEFKNAMKIIAQGINRIAGVYEKQEERAIRGEQRAIREEERALRAEQRDLIRYEKQEERAQLAHQINLMQRAKELRAFQKQKRENIAN
jgi:hypothetical protein